MREGSGLRHFGVCSLVIVVVVCVSSVLFSFLV